MNVNQGYFSIHTEVIVVDFLPCSLFRPFSLISLHFCKKVKDARIIEGSRNSKQKLSEITGMLFSTFDVKNEIVDRSLVVSVVMESNKHHKYNRITFQRSKMCK